MKAYWIRPETIGCYDEYDSKWVKLITALGYDPKNPPRAVLIAPIETND